MAIKSGHIPPGAPDNDPVTPDLLDWMSHQFTRFGDTYRASLYGTNVYVTRDLEFAHHVLVENSRNYIKGQFIKRVALLLGRGLMVSEGKLWQRQRRMIQPAFHPKGFQGAPSHGADEVSAIAKKESPPTVAKILPKFRFRA